MSEASFSTENTQSSESPVLPEGEHSAKEIFSRVECGLKTDHKYFVEKPPEKIDLSKEELKALESKEPFFVEVSVEHQNGLINRWESKINKGVVPYVFDPELGQRVERFAKAEELTGGDSGLLALAAISAKTPEQQAILYKTVSEIVLDVHQNNPALLMEWLNAQVDTSDPINSSFQMFHINQTQRFQKNSDTNEILVPPNLDADTVQGIWEPRIAELKTVISQDKFQPYHLRWIEYLSHSVNVPEVFEHIKAAQPKESEIKIEQQMSEVIEPGSTQKDIESETSGLETLHTGELGENIKEIDHLVSIVREKMKINGIERQKVTFNDGQILEVDIGPTTGLVFIDRFRNDIDGAVTASFGGYPVAEPSDIKSRFAITNRFKDRSLFYLGNFQGIGGVVGTDLRQVNENPLAVVSISDHSYRTAEPFSAEQRAIDIKIERTKLILAGLKFLEAQK